MATTLTFEDVGGCNCSSSTTVCYPCNLPNTNLTITAVLAGAHTGVATAVYSAGTWITPWTNFAGTSDYFKVTIGCTGTCTWYEALFSTSPTGPGSPSLSGYIAIPTGCGPGSIATGSFGVGTAGSPTEPFTCSPLNVEIGWPNAHAFITP